MERRARRRSLYYFVAEVFSKSFPKFISGKYIEDVCSFLQNNSKTIRVAPRDHFKSTSLYAHFMHRIWQTKNRPKSIEAHYFSYQESMSSYHIAKIRDLINRNPYFKDLKDYKTNAEGVIKYSWDGVHFITLEPHGLLAFKRGIHCDIVYIDDPFQDPQNKLLLTNIYKINNIFLTNIMDMPKIDGELHCVGTPQTQSDFFFDKNITQRFESMITPAILSEVRRIALWPEYMSYEELITRRSERGDNIFAQEYMCQPVYAANSYIARERLEETINKDLSSIKIFDTFRPVDLVFGGWDIGKKAHPAHFVVFRKDGNRAVMLHHKFMDAWNYSNGKEYNINAPTQLEYIKLAIKNFNINAVYYDATRGELEGFDEQGLLPFQLKPIKFNTNTKASMAAKFDSFVTQKRIEIIDDMRLINQIVTVTADLQAVESAEGHGDAFWSICLALCGSWETSRAPAWATGMPSMFADEDVPDLPEEL